MGFGCKHGTGVRIRRRTQQRISKYASSMDQTILPDTRAGADGHQRQQFRRKAHVTRENMHRRGCAGAEAEQPLLEILPSPWDATTS